MNSAPYTSSSEFFEQMYKRDADPWRFSSDAYETSRYEALIDSLAGERFERAFEPACSIGVLTERLASFCDELLALDLSETAVAHARERCVSYPNVHFQVGSVAEVDPGPLDLLVLSEIGYYFDSSGLETWSRRLFSCLRPGGVVLTCHWLGVSSDHVLAGDEVQNILTHLAEEYRFRSMRSVCTDHYRLDCWRC